MVLRNAAFVFKKNGGHPLQHGCLLFFKLMLASVVFAHEGVYYEHDSKISAHGKTFVTKKFRKSIKYLHD